MMAEHEGFVKVDRNMLHWKWMSEPLTAHLFMVLLLKANYKDLQFKNEKIPAGSLVTSYSNLCESSGLTVQQCRTALSRLKSTGEITSKSTNRYQVITIVNYCRYQSSTSKITGQQQANNKPTTNQQQQVKNIKNIKKGRRKEEYSRSAPSFPDGTPARGTDEFRRKSHLLLGKDEGTVDDIPEIYRQDFDNFADYWGYKNQ